MEDKINQLAENKLYEMVQSLESELLAMKTNPQVFGGDSTRMYESVGMWSGMLSFGSGVTEYFRATAIGAEGRFLTCNTLFEFGLDTADNVYEFGASTAYRRVFGIPYVGWVPNESYHYVALEGDPTTARMCFVKIYAYAIEPVEITVVHE